MTTLERFELTDRNDVVRLVNVFYDRVQDDAVLGPIFNDIAHVDWATHLPLMYDFWDSVLFTAGTFHGNPLAVHRGVARLAPLTGREFRRWLELFVSTVDDLFVGAMADHAKEAAARIATALQERLAAPNQAAGLSVVSPVGVASGSTRRFPEERPRKAYDLNIPPRSTTPSPLRELRVEPIQRPLLAPSEPLKPEDTPAALCRTC